MSLCKPGGGNDYVYCILCGVEYNPMQSVPNREPACEGRERLEEMRDQVIRLNRQIIELELVLAQKGK